MNVSNENQKEKEDKTSSSVPNSVIIYIKTRVPNYFKLTYEPSMSVPNSKSKTVYFEPLVKYYENPIKQTNNPSKDSVLTQFFEPNEFDTMINRILSDFRYMQKPRTFQQSFDEHIIDNNMNITLKTLFQNNSVIYIGKNPYTIVGAQFKPDSWQIEKKPLDKLLSQFPYLTPKQLEDDAKKQESEIPEEMRQGNLASSELSKEESTAVVVSGLQNATKETEPEITYEEPETFTTQDSLAEVSDEIKRLYSEYLQKNIPINYDDVPDKIRDTISLTLLITPNDLLNYINKNENSKIVDLYSSVIKSKISLQEVDAEYMALGVELANFKQTFSDENEELLDFLITNGQNVDESKTMKAILDIKIKYFEHMFKIAETIMNIYKEQHAYFVSLKELLVELKKEYINIIQYFKKPELALKCIEYDISMLNSMIDEDVEDPYSNAYFSNYNKFKDFYENKLLKNKQELLNPEVNFKDALKKYIDYPATLLIEQQQYNIYDFRLFAFYYYNQFDIWNNLFGSLQVFIKFVSLQTTELLNIAQSKEDRLNNNFSIDEQEKINKELDIDGIRADYDEKHIALQWYFVKSDGTKSIVPKKDVINKLKKFTSKKISNDEYYQLLYIDNAMAQVNAFDGVMLYLHLLEIYCLRQTKLNVSEENVNQINLETSISFNKYYEYILSYLERNQNPIIPSSLLWDTSKLTNISILDEKKKKNDRSYVIFKGRIKNIKESKEALLKSCEELTTNLVPNVSQEGFIKGCNDLIDSNKINVPNYVFRNNYWLNQTISNYDIQTTSELTYNIHNALMDAIVNNISDANDNSYLDWIVLDNDGESTIDSLYWSISEALNGQLDIDGSVTTNPYTELIDNVRIFTPKSLIKLVNDNNPNNVSLTWENIYKILQTTLRIKFITFELTKRTNDEIEIGDIVIYKNSKCRVINIDKSNNTYDLFNGHYTIEQINKEDVKQTNKNYLSNFRINCMEFDNNEDFDDFLYVSLSEKNDENNNPYLKFELIQNISVKSFIFQYDKIPSYIKYLIINSCLSKLISAEPEKFGLGLLSPEMSIYADKLYKPIDIQKLDIQINELNEELQELSDRKEGLEIQQNDDGLNMEEFAELTLITEEIEELTERIEQLNLIKQQQSQSQLGGDPNEFMYPNRMYYQPYPSPYPSPYQIQPHYLPPVISKDTKSKLSFYITIELELFPGKTASALDKSVVKCQSVFERIREAWSEIFGYQYRPAPMYLTSGQNSGQNGGKFDTQEKKGGKTKKSNKIHNSKKKTQKKYK